MSAEELADPGDHVRLRDRLVVADRQRGVGVRPRPLLVGDEELPRHAFHRGEHALVDDVPCAQLVVDHAEPLDGEIPLSRHG